MVVTSRLLSSTRTTLCHLQRVPIDKVSHNLLLHPFARYVCWHQLNPDYLDRSQDLLHSLQIQLHFVILISQTVDRQRCIVHC
jgi:hypothetical protein